MSCQYLNYIASIKQYYNNNKGHKNCIAPGFIFPKLDFGNKKKNLINEDKHGPLYIFPYPKFEIFLLRLSIRN